MRTQIPEMNYVETLNLAWERHLHDKGPDSPTVISTFAGCGGSSLGYSMSGFRELLAVEWEENAAQTFRMNFPDVPLYHGDIAKLTVDEVLERTGLRAGELDVFDGSPPCQGFSTAGRRRMDDSRNHLFLEFTRLLSGLKPKAFVMENVLGMVKGNMKLVFAEILKALKGCGYRVRACLVDAQYLGVPQMRSRLIFIGIRNDLHLEPTHPRKKTLPICVRSAISDLENSPEDRPMKDWLRESLHLMPATFSSKPIAMFLKKVKGRTGGFMGLKRLDPNRPSPTICKSEIHVAGLIHYSRDRYVTTRELARLGSFPDQFQFTDRKAANERIGNSVPPLMMAAIANHVRTILSDNSRL